MSATYSKTRSGDALIVISLLYFATLPSGANGANSRRIARGRNLKVKTLS
jgi:hypothetical protein